MSERSTETTVTFTHPFRFGALDAPQPPGTYLVVSEEEELPGVSFPAFRRTATLLHLPAIAATPASWRQMVPIDPAELTAALIADGERGPGQLAPGPAPGDAH